MALPEIRDILNNEFEKISLEEMDRVKLMDRVDLKFVFNEKMLPGFLHQVHNDYYSLEVAGTRMSRYETLYYDTPAYDLFNTHHNGRLNRFKIRMRRYVESDLNFFEVKYKNNKARTIKTRVKRDENSPAIEGNAEELLSTSANMAANDLVPKLWVNYTRITLVNRHEEERLTIDLDLEARTEDGKSHLFDGLVIVEAKQTKAHKTPFIKLLRDNHVTEGGMSKYCLAVYTLVDDIKKNEFKPDALAINKNCNH